MELIDKDAVVAEIERRIELFTSEKNQKGTSSIDKLSLGGRIAVLEEFKVFLYTFEVKEVDLDDYYHKFLEKEWFGKHCNRTMSEMMAFTAKHFFELGLRTQKGK